MRLSLRWSKWPCSRNFHISVPTVLALMGFCFCAIADTGHVIKYAPNPPYDNIPITPKTWEQVDLIYYSTISSHQYTNSIQLLRPIAWVHKRHMDTIGGKVTLSMPEFGITNVTATVKTIKPTVIDTRSFDWSNQNREYVIGRFMHYVTDVRTYTFKDSLGHISHITATPNHLFYVKNKHGFVSIGNISDNDTLVGILGFSDKYMDDAVHLVCDKGKHSHCGVSYGNNGAPVSVYNLEVYRRHVYRVGGAGVLVHNLCSIHEEYARELLSTGDSFLDDNGLYQYKGYAVRVSNSNPDIVAKYGLTANDASDGKAIFTRGQNNSILEILSGRGLDDVPLDGKSRISTYNYGLSATTDMDYAKFYANLPGRSKTSGGKYLYLIDNTDGMLPAYSVDRNYQLKGDWEGPRGIFKGQSQSEINFDTPINPSRIKLIDTFDLWMPTSWDVYQKVLL